MARDEWNEVSESSAFTDETGDDLQQMYNSKLFHFEQETWERYPLPLSKIVQLPA
jgi:hypothetical protein